MTGAEALLGAGVMAVAACLQGVVGFGSSLLAAPVLVLVDQAFVPAPVVMASFVLNLLITRREGSESVDPGVRFAMVGQAAGAVAAGAVVAQLPERSLSILFSCLVLAAVVISAAGWHVTPRPASLAGAGVVSGFMGTVSGIGGPPMALVYQHVDAPTLRGTLSRYFLAGTLVTLPTLAVVGLVGWAQLARAAVLVPGTVVGFLVSGRLTHRLDRNATRPVVLVLSGVSAVAVLIKALL